jgi:putative sterol carrier protein
MATNEEVAKVFSEMTNRFRGDDWFNIATGKLNVMQAFMAGKLKVQGDMALGMKLQPMFGL